MTKQLDALLEKEKKLKAQIQKAKSMERTLERKRQTRRKVLIGAAVLAKVEAGLWPQEDLLTMMDGFLTRPNERELFEFEGGVSEVGGVDEVRRADEVDETSQLDSPADSNKKLAAVEPVAAQRLPESSPASGFDNDDFQL